VEDCVHQKSYDLVTKILELVASWLCDKKKRLTLFYALARSHNSLIFTGILLSRL